MTEVYIQGSSLNNTRFFNERGKWALEYCKSYCGYNVEFARDVTHDFGEIASYKFHREQDAVMFALRWL